ncbi:DUF72 domain-containing protein [Tenacibaculum sp. C7A-26P2]|uniref:DUF72 domain-containing protein n=1 Tax=Tenacibaculum sp. C7A-26P2 TaxID=3447504 RepID=UPI003F846700
MKFGKVERPEVIDFSLPDTHPNTTIVLNSKKYKMKQQNVYIGCAKWNKSDLKGFYPQGIQDELQYYSSQFNSIELNATFYKSYSADQFLRWKYKTPKDFKFFPKLTQEISHWKRLEGVQDSVNDFLFQVQHLGEKLGTIFLQLNENFGPDNFKRVENFVNSWPKEIKLAIEVRHPNWFSDKNFSNEYTTLLRDNNITNIIVDTAGRRDMLHMNLTSNEAFIRYVGSNHFSDYDRLDNWVLRLKKWKELGLQNIHFFIHQNLEKESVSLASHFTKKINENLGFSLKIPDLKKESNQMTLF